MTPAISTIGFGLMCKPPRAGTSKTRLAASIGAEAASRLSAAFLSDCGAAAIEAAGRSPLALTAFYRPRDAAGEIAALLGAEWPLAFADEGSLGATMLDIMARLLAACPTGAMIMGADIPLIDADTIGRAADCLRAGSERTVVIAPSVDGGYCIIGIRSLAAAMPLFEEMAWSTPHVLAQTIGRAQDAKLEVTRLDVQRDIDEVHDLHWLAEASAAMPDRAKATRRVLSTLSLPPHR